MKIKVVIIAALLMTGCATTKTNISGFAQGENLITHFSKELTTWEVYKKKDGNYNSILWQNSEKGIDDSISVSITYNEHKNLNKFKKAIDSPGYQQCENFTTTSLEYAETSYPSIYWETLCTKGKFRAKMVHLMIQGNDSFYHIQKIWRGGFTKLEVSEWKSKISKSYICDTRKNEQSCPQGYKKVKDI